MLDLGKKSGPSPRCLVTNINLSQYIDHATPPTKKRPFSTISNQPFSHTLDVLLPAPGAEALQQDFSSHDHGTLHYAQVHLKLLDLITDDFFTTHIKSPGSNLLMLSEGRTGIDHLFSLREGRLRLEVDRATFQRLGLEGTVIPGPGGKHSRQRYRVEIDLRSPRMLRGKKGFERVVWAFENVLVERVGWLVVDLEDAMKVGEGPMGGHEPLVRRVRADVEGLGKVWTPVWPHGVDEGDYAEAGELLEWIGVATLGSSRVVVDDRSDPFLCRYQVPSGFGEARPQDLVRLRWRGLVHPSFAQRVFLSTLRAAGTDHWFAMSAVAFDGEAYTVLVNGGSSIEWRYKD